MAQNLVSEEVEDVNEKIRTYKQLRRLCGVSIHLQGNHHLCNTVRVM